MNYLAHLYLSFGHDDVLVGNFIADRVKGKQLYDYPLGIQKGIIMHRKIDAFTDRHDVVKRSKSRIRDRCRKFSGIVTDIYYDHFLSSLWLQYSDEPLLQFTRNCYKTLFRYYFIMPSRLKRILPWMAAGNWLYSYRDIDYISIVLKRFASRINFDSGIENGATELRLHYRELQQDFQEFFPELIEYSKGLMEQPPHLAHVRQLFSNNSNY
ncbi:MAG TPA: ACP phosphodiesterase [Bacteroidales bacterium]|nr:ACP phosphodiesterase [Bacteroidales bacterium]